MCNMCACVEYVSYIYMMYFAHKISRAYLSVECVYRTQTGCEEICSSGRNEKKSNLKK